MAFASTITRVHSVFYPQTVKNSTFRWTNLNLKSNHFFKNVRFPHTHKKTSNYTPEFLKSNHNEHKIDPLKPLTRSSAKKTFMTSTIWEEDMDPTGWYLTEKYDGIRLYWNGTDFYTRHGIKVTAPQSIISQMPKSPLDGELWTSYGAYQEAASLAQSPDENKWKNATYWVFDTLEMLEHPIELRFQHLKNLKSQQLLPSFINVVEKEQCRDPDHLKEYFKQVIAKGGEGVVLREPESLYKHGRSNSMRKFKPFFDAEVKVVENKYPKGFDCLQMNGNHLFVGVGDNIEAAKKLKEGAVITIKHMGENSHGTMLCPIFYRERADVNWDDLINA